jgi:hypothetical protein
MFVPVIHRPIAIVAPSEIVSVIEGPESGKTVENGQPRCDGELSLH